MKVKGFLSSLEPPRRKFLKSTLLGSTAALVLPALAGAREFSPESAASPTVSSFELEEATISDLQAGMTSGRYTAHSLLKSIWRESMKLINTDR